MKRANWIQALAVTALMASACGSTPTAGSTPSTSAARSNVPSPSTRPTALASPPPASAYLALVTLRGSSSYVVRDITDIDHPKTVSNLGAISAPVFVSRTELSYAVDSNLFRAPLAGSPKTLVTSHGGAGMWSPDGGAVIYTTSATPATVTVHQLRDGHDQVLGSIRGGGGGGCETIASCQIPNFLDFRLLYSPDGTLISLVTTGFSGSSLRIWSSSGAVRASSDAQGPTMSAWSGNGLYFRDNSGVNVWRDGKVLGFLPGLRWNRPRASAAGGQIVYAMADSAGWTHVYIVNTVTGSFRQLNAERVNPVFLTPRFIWYQGERACVASDACGPNPPFHPLSGKTYIFDLKTGKETESIITSVSDVWPHPA